MLKLFLETRNMESIKSPLSPMFSWGRCNFNKSVGYVRELGRPAGPWSAEVQVVHHPVWRVGGQQRYCAVDGLYQDGVWWFPRNRITLTLLPLKTTTRRADIYYAVKEFLVEKKLPLENLASVSTDGEPTMIGRHTGFIAHCEDDTEYPNLLHYHCVIHQQALCAKLIGLSTWWLPSWRS